MTTPSAFDPRRCPTLESSGVDPQLAALFKRSMLALQSSARRESVLETEDETIRAVQLWMLHYAIVLFGTCDAARLLITHNLARESLTNQRHAFEIVVRAGYLGANPTAALNELRSKPIRQLKRLELSKAPHDADFFAVKAEAEAVLKKYPELASFKLPSVEVMLGDIAPANQILKAQLYGREYRLPSKLVHGDVESFDLTMTAHGSELRPTFDSRRPPWWLNQVVVSLTSYVAPYPNLIAIAFERQIDPGPMNAMNELTQIDQRLSQKNQP